jgi:tetraacyldisaccharide 4'-kinase
MSPGLERLLFRPGEEPLPERARPLLRLVLVGLSLVFGLVVRLRRALYAHGLARRRSLPVPVVSVGNLTVGGSGKTPLVQVLARELARRRRRPVVLSRGYRGRREEDPAVVSDGERVLLSAMEAGDEPVMLARAVEGLPVVVGRERAAAGRLAIERFAPGVLLLDDGFQHLRLQRDFDIVVLNGAQRPPRRVLPAGLLREPWSALRRADAVVIAHADGAHAEALRTLLARVAPDAPRFEGRHRPTHLVLHGTAERRELDRLAGRRVLAFCGLADPSGFRRTLDELGAEVAVFRSFPDHHEYGPGDLEELVELAGAHGAEMLLTTAKDAVKLPAPWQHELPLLVLYVEFAFSRPGELEGLLEAIEEAMDRAASAARRRSAPAAGAHP